MGLLKGLLKEGDEGLLHVVNHHTNTRESKNKYICGHVHVCMYNIYNICTSQSKMEVSCLDSPY